MLMTRLDPRLLQYDAARTQQFYELLSQRLRQTRGVVSTALTQNPPLGLDTFDRLTFVPEGYDLPRGRENVKSFMDTIDDGYFSTLGIAVTSGRAFTAADNASAPRVAIVNEQFAKHYWRKGDAVGRIRILPWIADEIRRLSGIDEVSRIFFLSYAHWPTRPWPRSTSLP